MSLPKKNITLRTAKPPDKERVFNWRNNEKIRRFAVNPEIINWETHSAWFDEILISKDSFLLIGEISHKPIGVIRYDIKNYSAEISIYLVPEFQGKGLGVPLICKGNEWLKKHLPFINKIRATILAENETSKNVFRKAGFKLVSHEMEFKY